MPEERARSRKAAVAANTVFASTISGVSALPGAMEMRMTSRSWTIIEAQDMANPTRLPNIHPGEVLLEEFLKPKEISQNALARAIRVPPRRVNEIVLGKRAITAGALLRDL